MAPRCNDGFPSSPARSAYKLRNAAVLGLAVATLLLGGCFLLPREEPKTNDIVVAELDPLPHPVGSSVSWRAVKNEWVDAFFLVTPTASARSLWLSGSNLPAGVSVNVYRVEPVPVDTVSVDAVRDAGPGVAHAEIPAALVPLATNGDGSFVVPAGASLLYLEVKAPIEAPPGTYRATVTLDPDQPTGIPVSLVLDDVALSDSPEFALCGTADYDDLARLFPKDFAGVLPNTLTRGEGSDVRAVERLDSIVRLARDNRVDVGFSRLQPIVKNTPREGLRIDWSSYDSVVLPWLTGDFDRARAGMTAFPIPVPDLLRSGGVSPRAFLAAAASHFDQNRLASRAVVPPELLRESLPNAELSSRLRRPQNQELRLPLTDRGVRQLAWRAFATDQLTISVGQVAPDVAPDLGLAPDVAPDIGAAAAVGGSGAPSGAPGTDPSLRPQRQVWFYPGEAFGVAGVVPGIGIKHARRALQDYEIFDLARQRGARALARSISSKATRLGEPSPPLGGDLLTPSVSAQTWDGGLAIIRSAIVARSPGGLPTRGELSEESDALARWSAPLDVVPAIPDVIQYAPDGTIAATLSLAGTDAVSSLLIAPDGWAGTGVSQRVVRQPGLEQLGGRLTLSAHLEPTQIRYPVGKAIDAHQQPMPENGTLRIRTLGGADGVEGFTRLLAPVAQVVPATASFALDGRLDEWSAADLIHSGGLIRMLDRYSAQLGSPARSPKATDVFARWDESALYLAIRAEGVGPQPTITTSVVPVSRGRAYGRDLLHITLAPLGQPGVQLLVTPQSLTLESPGPNVISSASTLDGGVWRCEIKIPASVLGAMHADSLFRFNIVRHDAATGESSSWAGPIDQDTQPWQGLLHLADHVPMP